MELLHIKKVYTGTVDGGSGVFFPYPLFLAIVKLKFALLYKS